MKKTILFAAAVLCGALCANAQNYENDHEWVDLGLPSGLKWATCNVGATTPEGYGDYFAWGETAPKDNYSWDTYNHGTMDNQTKYSVSVDGKTVLDLEDDAASVNWGGKWRMPTKDECSELIDNCVWTWTDNYNGVKGYEVKSKTNGNGIFLPAAGFRYNDKHSNFNFPGGYWSSSLYPEDSNFACRLLFNQSQAPKRDVNNRYFGWSVRPVVAIYTIYVNVEGNGAVVSDKTMAQMGDEVTLTIEPDEGYILEQLVVKQGKTEIAVFAGRNKVVFTLQTTGDVTVSATFKQPEWVDLGLPSGLKWATMNVGATAPEGYGDHFAWGETEPKDNYSWNTYAFTTDGGRTFTKYNTDSQYGTVDDKTVLEASDDAAAKNWGGAWRMPTDAEWTELRGQCVWTWTTLKGVNGYEGKSRANGNAIFLPAAGYRYDSGGISSAGNNGYYWSSSLGTDKPVYALYADFKSGYMGYGKNYRHIGYSVRPVYKTTPTVLRSAECVALYAENGRIVCEQDFRIFDLLGRDVTRQNGTLCGVYVVKTADAAQKVVVK